MATLTSNNATLRTNIQNAQSVDVVSLTADTYTSATTLAKFVSFSPLVRQTGYTVASSSVGTKRAIPNTRIYQQNIDGPYAPSNVRDIRFDYTSGNTAIFRATSGTYAFTRIQVSGTHSGWAGNGGVYMSMTVSNGLTPITTNLNLSNSIINVGGQVGTAAFLQSWNNTGNVTIAATQFDEANYNTSFHLASINSGGALHGNYTIINNGFGRSTNQNVRNRGNRLESVNALLTGNTFREGSYLDIAGDISSISISGNNFQTIADGYGINLTQTSSTGATLSATSTSDIFSNNFTGYGLAFTYANPAPNAVFTVNATNNVAPGTFVTKSFDRFSVGGSGGNTITVTDSNNWINGGDGADTISTSGGGDNYIIGGAGADSITVGAGADTIFYYGTNEGADTITGFTTGTDKLAFRNGGGGVAPFGSPINFQTSSPPTTSSPTWVYVGGVLTYDADGNGGGSAVTIATFTGAPTIAATDLVLF